MINFPSSPADGQVYYPAGGPIFTYRSGKNVWARNAGTAHPENRLVNGSMMVSQQNGDAVNTVAGTGSYYPADEWISEWSVAGVTLSSARVAMVSPNGSPYAIEVSISSGAKPTLATGDSHVFRQRPETSRMLDLRWGYADARHAILRFWCSCTVGGTFQVRLSNSWANSSFLAPFTAAAGGLWTENTIIVPPPTVGTGWADYLPMFDFYTLGGTAIRVGVPGWQSGEKHLLAGRTNFIATAPAALRITDIGFYVDLNNTGVPPQFQQKDWQEEFDTCQRYWHKVNGLRGNISAVTTINAAQGINPVRMAYNPALAIVGTVRGYDSAVAPNLTSIVNANARVSYIYPSLGASAGGMVAGRPGGTLIDAQEANYIAVSARP